VLYGRVIGFSHAYNVVANASDIDKNVSPYLKSRRQKQVEHYTVINFTGQGVGGATRGGLFHNGTSLVKDGFGTQYKTTRPVGRFRYACQPDFYEVSHDS
jgi:hypothetical protein